MMADTQQAFNTQLLNDWMNEPTNERMNRNIIWHGLGDMKDREQQTKSNQKEKEVSN